MYQMYHDIERDSIITLYQITKEYLSAFKNGETDETFPEYISNCMVANGGTLVFAHDVKVYTMTKRGQGIFFAENIANETALTIRFILPNGTQKTVKKADILTIEKANENGD